MPEEDSENRKVTISKQLHFTFDYNKHCCERINIYNKKAEEFIPDEMTTNFFIEKNYLSNDNDSPF